MDHAPQYPSNSLNKNKPNLQAVPATEDQKPKPKVINQVVSTPVTRKKRGLGKAFLSFFGGDDGRSVGEYVILGIVAPAAQQMLFQILNQSMNAAQKNVTNAINRGFNVYNNGQQTQYPNPLRGNFVQGHTPYNNMGGSGGYQPGQHSPMMSPAGRRMHNFDEIIIEDISEANAVIQHLQTLLSEYPNVTVADLYQIVGIQPAPVDSDWGWTDLTTARVINAGRGYRLALPRPIPVPNYY